MASFRRINGWFDRQSDLLRDAIFFGGVVAPIMLTIDAHPAFALSIAFIWIALRAPWRLSSPNGDVVSDGQATEKSLP